ncbi:hypothetical protein FS842_004917 [Serendipita sp. 407]|nr:hypothetical protein FS842_004917 [Serendipita sp. 407]
MELGVYAAGLGALVLVETIGKIGTVGNLVETSIEMKGDPGAGVGAGPSVGFGPAFIAQTETLLPGGSGHGGHRDETGKSTALEYVVGSKRFKRDELTAYEKGEEDVGGENSVGLMKAVSIRRGQRTGLAAF